MASEFQRSVWSAIAKIPKGRVTTYSAIAKYIDTKAVRAVGTAVGKNPDAPEVPCHRVILSSGSIGSYSGQGGVDTKIRLLRQEGVEIAQGKAVDFERVMYSFEE